MFSVTNDDFTLISLRIQIKLIQQQIYSTHFKNLLFTIVNHVNIMINFNSEFFNFRSDFELFQNVVVNFDDDIDLSTADAKTIKKYINNRIQVYKEHNTQNTNLRTVIKEEFANFIENHWKQIDIVTFIDIIDYCLTNEFWINCNNNKRFKVLIMTKVINEAINEKDYESKWILKQIKYVKKRHLKISSRTLKTKSQLISNEFESKTQIFAKYFTISIQRSTVTWSSLRYESSEITLIKQEYEESSAINFFRQSTLISQDARIQRFYQRDQSKHQRDASQSKHQRAQLEYSERQQQFEY